MPRLLEIGLSNAAMAMLLAVVAAGLCRLYRRPAVAHGLWLLVLLKLLTPPLLPVPLPRFDSRQPSEQVSGETVPLVLEMADFQAHPDVPPAEHPPEKAAVPAWMPGGLAATEGPARGPQPVFWPFLVFLVWLAGSLGALAWAAWSVVLFRRLLRFARKADPTLQDLAKELAGKLGLTRHPEVWLLPANISPMLWALGLRPRLLFPAQLVERLDREQLRTILLHELAHWRRGDHWVRLLELLVVVLYWWNPVVWWARGELREAEEQCCDAWVVAALEGAGRTYALALLETVAFLSRSRLPLPASASGIGQVFHLRRRLTMILSGQQRRSMTTLGCAGLAAFAMLVLPLIPVLAQEPEKKPVPSTGAGLVLDLDGDLKFVIAGDDSPDKEAVELLKRALKLLAEKKQARTKPAPKKADPAEVEKARHEVEALSKEAAQRRSELRAVEAKLHKAQAHLAGLEGKPAARIRMPLEVEWKFEHNPATVKSGTPQVKILELKPQPGEKVDGKKPVIISNILVPAKKSQPDDLKARLDRLMKEVEELRKEIEHARAPKPPQEK
jgi:beta-lactamase regulating signal transducer with metallopeptidase domain